MYTQEVLAVVLQHLMDHPEPSTHVVHENSKHLTLCSLSTLLSLQVIQSIGVCPRLVNFVMTILTKLIYKQVMQLILILEEDACQYMCRASTCAVPVHVPCQYIQITTSHTMYNSGLGPSTLVLVLKDT